MSCGACGKDCGGTCSACSKNPCSSCCKNPCLRWGFDGCYLRGRCADGTELDPLNLCNWLKVHETCTELRLVTKTTMNDSYMEFINECDESHKIYVCDFLGLGSIRCLGDVWWYPDHDSGQPGAVRNCDIMMFGGGCTTDPDDPKYGKWAPYHIPDAGDCVIQPDAEGYSKVLVKDACGCIKECKLFVQPNTYEYALRDSWPDDPDWPFSYGSLKGNDTEIIDIELDKHVPLWGTTDLEVTIQYAYGIQNHVYGTYRNYKSTVTPSNKPTHTPSLADQYSKSIVVQGCNLSPWGSWEWQVSRTFIVPKGEKLYLTHEILVHDMQGQEVAKGDNTGSSRLHALHVFVRATKGVRS